MTLPVFMTAETEITVSGKKALEIAEALNAKNLKPLKI